jgi:hypothetical protein
VPISPMKNTNNLFFPRKKKLHRNFFRRKKRKDFF